MSAPKSHLVYIWTLALLVFGCGGNATCPGSGEEEVTYTLTSATRNLEVLPGQTGTFTVSLSKNPVALDKTFQIGFEALADGWSAAASPSSLYVTGEQTVNSDISLTAPPNAAPGSFFILRVTAVSGEITRKHLVTVEVPSGDRTTGIQKKTDFQSGPDGVFVSTFDVINGPPLDLVGSLQFVFNPNVLYWYRPDNILDLHVNESASFELVAVPRDSSVTGPHVVSATFFKSGTTYAYESSFSVPANENRSYSVQVIDSGVSNTTVNDESFMTVTVDLPPGKAGTYTLTIENSGVGLTPIVTPSSQMIDSLGTPVTFDVILRRTAPDSGNGVRTHEPVFIGTHDSAPETNFRQVWPVFGRP